MHGLSMERKEGETCMDWEWKEVGIEGLSNVSKEEEGGGGWVVEEQMGVWRDGEWNNYYCFPD